MPRILRIVNRFNLGGPTYNACYLTKYLSPEFETLLIGGQKEEHEASSEFIPKSLGVEYTILPELQRSINPSKDRKAYREIKKIIADFKPDIVHTHASKAGALGRKAAAKMKVPVIVHTFHGNVFEGYFGKAKTQFYINAERHLAKLSDAIIAISPKQKRDLGEKFKIAHEDKIRLVPLGFDLQRFHIDQEQKRLEFREKYNLKDEVAIGIIGRLAPIKNHRFFLDQIKALSDSNFNFKALIIGGGELEAELKTYVDELNISDQVIFTSWIEDVSNPLAGLDIVALTSLNEGTPVSLIEAQAAGKPVISTDIGGVGDVVKHGQTGFVVDQNDFQSHLEMLINDPELRESFGDAGRPWATQNFGVERLAADTAQLYRELLST